MRTLTHLLHRRSESGFLAEIRRDHAGFFSRLPHNALPIKHPSRSRVVRARVIAPAADNECEFTESPAAQGISPLTAGPLRLHHRRPHPQSDHDRGRLNPHNAPQDDLAFSAFRPVVKTIATEALRFGEPVYLLNGNSHIFADDRPLDGATASPVGLATTWTSFYGVPAVPNLRRVTVDGSTDALNYLRVTVDEDAPEPLSWVRVPFTG